MSDSVARIHTVRFTGKASISCPDPSQSFRDKHFLLLNGGIPTSDNATEFGNINYPRLHASRASCAYTLVREKDSNDKAGLGEEIDVNFINVKLNASLKR
eukprot:scaffold10312_cov141-Skeletonema_marinoi.AAC.8